MVDLLLRARIGQADLLTLRLTFGLPMLLLAIGILASLSSLAGRLALLHLPFSPLLLLELYLLALARLLANLPFFSGPRLSLGLA